MNRKRLVTLSALALALPVCVAGGLLLGASSSPSFAKMLDNPADVLAGRSPGERVAGALTSTKNERVKSLARRLADSVTGPKERVLALVNERPDIGLGDPIPGSFDGLPTDVLGDPLSAGQVPGLGAPGPFSGIPVALPAVGGGTPDSGSGGTGGTGGGGTPTPTPTDTPTSAPTDTPTDTPTSTPTSTPTDTPTGTPTGTPTDPSIPVVPAVPEPSTWLTMIAGFFAIGHVMRRRESSVARFGNRFRRA